jgi:hypothetical protein
MNRAEIAIVSAAIACCRGTARYRDVPCCSFKTPVPFLSGIPVQITSSVSIIEFAKKIIVFSKKSHFFLMEYANTRVLCV